MGCCQNAEEKIEEIQEVLNIHNKLREKHNSPPLKINETLNNLARECVRKLSNEETFSNNIYKGKFLGENIYIYNGKPFTVKDMCDVWYDEIKNYDRDQNKYQKNTSHFTQMIWKETKEIGFAYKKRKSIYYAFVYYYPPCNTLGDYNENVLFSN